MNRGANDVICTGEIANFNKGLKKSSIIINGPIISFASIVGILNVLYVTDRLASLIVVFFEMAILGYYILKKDIVNFFGCYLVFLCLSFEFTAFVGTQQFYGFKNFRIFGTNLGVIALLPILVLALFKGVKLKEMKSRYPNIFKFAISIVFMSMTGLAFGALQLLTNDNDISDLGNTLSTFIGVTYTMTVVPLLVIVAVIYILSWERQRIHILEKYLTAILISTVISMLVSLITGKLGEYGGLNTILVANVAIFVPFILTFPFYRGYANMLIVPVGLLGTYQLLLHNASGKLVILTFFVLITVSIIVHKRRNILFISLFFLLIPFVIIDVFQVLHTFAQHSSLFNTKLNDTVSMFKVWSPDWLTNMSLSPRTRVVEFISIVREYLYKPWFLPFGKGYMGTFKDYTGLLHAAYIPGAYSANQWASGAFYGAHETFNTLFLYNGLFGLVVYFLIIRFMIKNFARSPWVLIGGGWFVMFYGYSVTISAFGLTALLLAYVAIDGVEDGNRE